jgi:hypothetical protein
MKIAIAIGVLIASLGACAIVPVDYGYRGDRHSYRSDGYYSGDRYYRGYYRGDTYSYRGDRYYRSYSNQDHGQ